MEALLSRKFPRCSNKYKDKLSLKCFPCKQIGQIATRCPNTDEKDKARKFKGKWNKKGYVVVYEGVKNDKSKVNYKDEVFFVVKKETT